MKKPGYWYCEMWRMNFWYFFGWEPEEFEKWIRKRHDKDYTVKKLVAGLCLLIENNQGRRIAIFVKKQTRQKMISSLVHECVHAASWTLDTAGFRPDFNNDEPVAYLTEAIFTHGVSKEKSK